MYYATTFERAFNNLGWEADVMPAHFGLEKKQYIKRFFQKIGFSFDNEYNSKMREYNKTVCNCINNKNYDLVYVCFLPKYLTSETIKLIKKKTKIVLHLPDTLSSAPNGSNNIELFDIVFSYENSDVNYLKKRGINAYPLMGSYDETQYYHIDCNKTIDVSFVGKMYDERVKLLKRLALELPNVAFAFYGEYAPIRKPVLFLKWLLNKRIRKAFKNKNIHYSVVNRIYNESKIVLDIHCIRSQNGWSSRLPEISATGSFQIVDNNPAIEKEFGNDFIIFKNYKDLKNKIIFYLENDEKREKIARLEHEHTKNMTRTNNISEILSVMNCSDN